MNREEELLHYIRHYRHDWMNHMQLMKAYLSMNRIDDAKRVMDQVILQAQNETKLSQLEHPELAFYILTYNWKNQGYCKLEIEINHDQEMLPSLCIPEKYPYLYMWIKEITEAIEQRVDERRENLLLYQFNIVEEALSLRIEFEGSWEGKSGREIFRQLEEKITAEQGKLEMVECSDQELILELFP